MNDGEKHKLKNNSYKCKTEQLHNKIIPFN